MKQYLDAVQTADLITLGFPQPKSVSRLSLDWDMDTIPSFNYSIGELISFLPDEEDMQIFWSTCKSGGYWYVDCGLRRIGIDRELIDALFFACKQLKKDGVI